MAIAEDRTQQPRPRLRHDGPTRTHPPHAPPDHHHQPTSHNHPPARPKPRRHPLATAPHRARPTITGLLALAAAATTIATATQSTPVLYLLYIGASLVLGAI